MRRSSRSGTAAATNRLTINFVPPFGSGRSTTSPNVLLVISMPSISPTPFSNELTRATFPAGASTRAEPSFLTMFKACGVKLTKFVISILLSFLSQKIHACYRITPLNSLTGMIVLFLFSSY